MYFRRPFRKTHDIGLKRFPKEICANNCHVHLIFIQDNFLVRAMPIGQARDDKVYCIQLRDRLVKYESDF